MRALPAFEMRNGRAVRCDNSGPERHVVHVGAMSLRDPLAGNVAAAVVQGMLWPLLSDEEREPWFGLVLPAVRTEKQTGHAFVHASDPDLPVAVLYLPEGDDVTFLHCDAIHDAMTGTR